jgi:hypothetical protein
MSKRKEFATYGKHYKDFAEGHVFLDKENACTITLTGAASMSQEELDKYAEIMTKALNQNKDDKKI